MNAIILAAGLGSRFKEKTKNNHKALLPIGGIPNIERTITYLKGFGVNDIFIVTGHMNYLFDYLKDKFGCHLIFNKYYKDYNNIYSFLLAIDYFNDSIVIDSDVVLLENVFSKRKTSFYYTTQRAKSEYVEWVPILNSTGRVTDIKMSNEYKPALLGISYWNSNDCKIIKENSDPFFKESSLKDPKLYWDDIPIKLLDKIYVETLLLNENAAFEMDNIENYNMICYKYSVHEIKR